MSDGLLLHVPFPVAIDRPGLEGATWLCLVKFAFGLEIRIAVLVGNEWAEWLSMKPLFASEDSLL